MVKSRARPKRSVRRAAKKVVRRATRSAHRVVRRAARRVQRRTHRTVHRVVHRTIHRARPVRRTEVRREASRPQTITTPSGLKKRVGIVTHFYDHIDVAVVQLSDTVRQGEKISIEGASTNVQQRVDSMQIEHMPVKEAKRGQSIGLKVRDRVREHDIVYRL